VSTTPEAVAEPSALRHNKPYMLLMSGRTIQLIGAGIGAFAVPLIAYGITGSVAKAGAIAAVGEIGGVLVALPAGVVVDRVDRRKLIIGCAAVGILAWGWAATSGLAGWLTGWQLAAVLFVSAMITAFIGPAESGAIRMVVPATQMHQAMAAVQGRGAVASLLGGPVGGLLYGLGRMVPIMANAIGQIVVLIATLFVRARLNAERDTEPEHPVRSLVDGLRYCWRVPLMRASLGLFALVNLVAGALIIAITLELVQTGTKPFLIGLIEFVSGGAMLIGSLFAGRLLDRIRVGPITITTLALLSVSLVGMALIEQYWAFLVLLAVPLMLAPALNAGLGGYVVSITPDALQGRLNSVLSLCWLVSAPLSPVLGSQLLANVGIGVTLWVLAGLLVITVVLLIFVRPLWRIGLPDSWSADVITWPPTARAAPVQPQKVDDAASSGGRQRR
jgi:MFS family permease